MAALVPLFFLGLPSRVLVTLLLDLVNQPRPFCGRMPPTSLPSLSIATLPPALDADVCSCSLPLLLLLRLPKRRSRRRDKLLRSRFKNVPDVPLPSADGETTRVRDEVTALAVARSAALAPMLPVLLLVLLQLLLLLLVLVLLTRPSECVGDVAVPSQISGVTTAAALAVPASAASASNSGLPRGGGMLGGFSSVAEEPVDVASVALLASVKLVRARRRARCLRALRRAWRVLR